MDKKNKTEQTNLINRPPVVAVVGHIDHGKSSLLDYIRKTNTIQKEEGGITQHVSAYEVEVEIGENAKSKERRKMTFLDTPGHEAFCSIRERSTSVADIVILVISAGISGKTRLA